MNSTKDDSKESERLSVPVQLYISAACVLFVLLLIIGLWHKFRSPLSGWWILLALVISLVLVMFALLKQYHKI